MSQANEKIPEAKATTDEATHPPVKKPRFTSLSADNEQLSTNLVMSQVNEKIPEATTAATEETTDPTVKKSSSESSAADTPSGTTPTIPSTPGAGFPGKPLDLSFVAGLLNDPTVKELTEQIVKDPSFSQMVEQIRKTFKGVEAGISQFDTQQYSTTMQQIMQNTEFMNMAERIRSALMQGPSTSQMLENSSNPAQKDQLDKRMTLVEERLDHIEHLLEEMATGGPTAVTAVIKYWKDKGVLQKLGAANGLPVTGDGETEAANKVESIVHQTASVGDVEQRIAAAKQQEAVLEAQIAKVEERIAKTEELIKSVMTSDIVSLMLSFMLGSAAVNTGAFSHVVR